MPCFNGFAQEILRCSLIKYDQSDGISSYNIKDIVKDKKGFLWVASQDGLTRKDGGVFTLYSRQSPPRYRLSGPEVRRIVEDSTEEILWVLPNNNGLDVISTQTGIIRKRIAIPAICAEDWNITLLNKPDKIWIGSFCGLKVFKKRENRFLIIPTVGTQFKKNSFDFEVNCIAEDQLKNIWACYSGFGIVIYDGNSMKKIKEIPIAELGDTAGTGLIRFTNYLQINGEQILFSTNQGLRKIRYDREYNIDVDRVPCSGLPSMNISPVEAIARYKDEILISGNNGLYKFDSSLNSYFKFEESIGPSESKWINSVQSIYVDDDIIWLAAHQGVAKLDIAGNPFIKYYYDEKSGVKLEHIRSVICLPNGDFICGLRSGLIQVRKNDSFLILDNTHLYHHLFTDVNGRTILSRNDGLFCMVNKKLLSISKFYPEFSAFEKLPVNSHIFLGDSIVIMGTENDNGILLWNYKRHTVIQITVDKRQLLASNTVNNIFLDSRNRIWVLSDKTINILNAGFSESKLVYVNPAKDDINLGLFFDMCEARNSYWLSSYGNGIVELDQNFNFVSLIRKRNGLSDEGVYNIFNVGDSSLIVTTNNGLSVYNIMTGKFKNYFLEDGLHSNQFEEVAAGKFKKLIYAGGVNGFTIIDPSKILVNSIPPRFYFKSVQVRTDNAEDDIDSTDLEMQEVIIPENWLQATVSFAGINFRNSKRVVYQYRIPDKDSGWIDIRSQNFVSILGLNPGVYHLQVRSGNEDSFWSLPKTIKLIIEPKWFQTWWFFLLLFTLLIGLAYGIYRYRIEQIKDRQKMLHQVRENIAGDLHDDIGSTLNSIKIFTHLAEDSNEKQKYFSLIKESLSNASSGLRDLIWVLDDSNDNADEMLKRLKSFSQPLSEAKGITIKFETQSGDLTSLNKTEKRNLLLISKEAINNAIKYSECRNIRIFFASNYHSRLLKIEDDGKGFEENEIIPGNGLKNLRARAIQINYTLTILSKPGEGTSISLESNR